MKCLTIDGSPVVVVNTESATIACFPESRHLFDESIKTTCTKACKKKFNNY